MELPWAVSHVHDDIVYGDKGIHLGIHDVETRTAGFGILSESSLRFHTVTRANKGDIYILIAQRYDKSHPQLPSKHEARNKKERKMLQALFFR